MLSIYIHARCPCKQCKHHLVESSDDPQAGAFHHPQFTDGVGGRVEAVRRSLQVRQRFHQYHFSAPNCRDLRAMEQVKIAFDLAHLFTRTQ